MNSDMNIPQVKDMCPTFSTPFRTVIAQRFIRKMRGGTQAHLVQADDGEFYVVKFCNNPQGRRVLVNDALGSVLLRYLGISAPEPVIVNVTPEFLEQNPDVSLQFSSHRTAVETGLHFGSRYPGDPDRLAVFDFFPDRLLPSIDNVEQFLGALVFDKWVANTDHRQAVFFRNPGTSVKPQPQQPLPFHALMIDQGLIFGGLNWDFRAGPLHGLYTSGCVYEGVRSLGDFEPWLEKVTHFPEVGIENLVGGLPQEWIEGEEPELTGLLEALVLRRGRVRDLIRDCGIAQPSRFPNWRRSRAKAQGRAFLTPLTAMVC